MFSSPLSDLALAGSTTERTKGNIYESIDSAKNNSTTSHPAHSGVLCICAANASSLPPPDGGYPNGNTAEGLNALFSLTTGALNTALGGAALYFTTTSNYNTAVGFEAAAFNTTGEANTATGAYALLHNTTGQRNVANGAAALITNTTGEFNCDCRYRCATPNVDGFNNSAFGDSALFSIFTPPMTLPLVLPRSSIMTRADLALASTTRQLAFMRSSVTLIPLITPLWGPSRSWVMTPRPPPLPTTTRQLARGRSEITLMRVQTPPWVPRAPK